MSVLIDTNQLDPRERSDALQAVLTRATAPRDLTLLGSADEVHARAHGRHDGPERVVFVLHGGGSGSYVHDGTACRLNQGGLYVTDLSSCHSCTRPGDGSARIVQVERSALGLTAEQVQSASAHLPESPFYDLLRSHIPAHHAAPRDLALNGREAALAACSGHSRARRYGR